MTTIAVQLPVRWSRPAWITAPVLAGSILVLVWVTVALTASWWAPHDPLATVGRRLQAPGARFWFGTDALGRDVFSRTMYGAAYSIPIAVIVVIVSGLFGSTLGALAGFRGGAADAIVMRAVDVTQSMPPILLAMAVTASLGPGLPNAAIAIVIVWWPIYARLMRAQVMAVNAQDHVAAAIAGGATPARLLLAHILPLCWTPTLVNATMDFGQVVLLAASLSFIGLGALPPTPEWGSMISDGAVHFYNWWIAAAPGAAILSVILGFNFLGDGLRDLLDPRRAE